MHQSPHKMARSWRLRLPSAWDHPSTFGVAQLGLGISSESGLVSLRSWWQVGHCRTERSICHVSTAWMRSSFLHFIFMNLFCSEYVAFSFICGVRPKHHSCEVDVERWQHRLILSDKCSYSWPRFLVSRIFASKLGRLLTTAGTTLLLILIIII